MRGGRENWKVIDMTTLMPELKALYKTNKLEKNI